MKINFFRENSLSFSPFFFLFVVVLFYVTQIVDCNCLSSLFGLNVYNNVFSTRFECVLNEFLTRFERVWPGTAIQKKKKSRARKPKGTGKQ